MIKVLIVDDESLARKRLERLLAEIDDVTVVGEAANGMEAIQMADKCKPDIVLLDIRMPGMDGLKAAEKLAQQEIPPAVIFCTAFDDFALQAFEAEALAYLVKPVRSEDLVRAVMRVTKNNRAQLAENGMEVRKHLHCKSHRGIELIPVDEVQLLQADHKYVTAYCKEQEAVLNDTLKNLEDEFSHRFIRVHRNALVAKDAIKGLVQVDGHTAIQIRDLDIQPVVSRRLEPKLRKLIMQL